MKSISVSELFNGHAEELALRWKAGRRGALRTLCVRQPEPPVAEGAPVDGDKGSAACSTLIGHLSLIHPSQIQVLGEHEAQYLTDLESDAYDSSVKRLFAVNPVCVILADGIQAGRKLVDEAERSGTALFESTLSGDEVVSSLAYYLARELAENVIIHGVFMEVMGAGVLITGASGVGKSELALELVNRGHRLIADDAPQFTRVAPDIVLGTCPHGLEDFLEVRGIGIINVRALFGDSAVKHEKYLRLIVNLVAMNDEELQKIDRLNGSKCKRQLLGVDIPEVTLPVTPGRNLAVLIECAARNQLMQTKGYDAVEDFISRQRAMVAENSGQG